MCIYIYIYIYIYYACWRATASPDARYDVYVRPSQACMLHPCCCIYMHTSVCIYIYIYTYIHREREREILGDSNNTVSG